MAYGVKYRAEWRATTRGERHYVVDFLKRDYAGEVEQMYLTGDCIVITYGAVDESELMPIKSSQADITILCTSSDSDYSGLYTLDPAMYQVVIYEDESAIWRGYLATGEYQQPLAKVPYTVRFRANDGLSVLKAKPYLSVNGSRFTGSISISELIRRLLSPISDNVDIWHYNLIYANQPSPTFDIVNILEDAIYIALGEDITYYDVLEAVLKNFGVQLLQQDGVWVVRSLSTLATAVNSNLVNVISLDNKITPGYGISSDAVLSLLPPLKKMSVANRQTAEISLSEVVSQADSWQASSGYPAFVPKIVKYGDAIKISANGEIGYVMGTAILPIRRIYTRSKETSITLTADIYSGNSAKEGTVNIGIWLCEPNTSVNENVVNWRLAQIVLNRKTIAWDADNKNWKNISTMDVPTATKLGLRDVQLIPYPGQTIRPALSTLPKTSVTLELPNIPYISTDDVMYDSWEIVLVLAVTGAVQRSFYLSNVNISIANGEEYESEDIRVSNDGITSESYDVLWRSATRSLNGNNPYLTLLDMSREGRAVYGYIEASGSCADKDVVGKMLADLRKKTTRNIEGIVDKKIAYGANNAVRYDDRYYYTNFVKHLLKRGVADIQLRELPQLTEVSGTHTFSFKFMPTSMIGIDRSLYYISAEDRIARIDTSDMTVKHLASLSGSSTLRPGVRCVVAGDATCVRAYDDNSNLVSEISAFSDDKVSLNSFLSTAVYDAVTQIWIASDGGANVVICDVNGYVISRMTCDVTPKQPTDVALLPYEGGFIYRFADSGKYYSYWHSYSIHSAGVFEANWILANANITHISKRYLIYKGSDGRSEILRIMHQDLRSGLSAFASIAAQNEIIAVNNAIILTRSSSGAAVYDTRRTVSSRYYSLGLGSATSLMALCGDVVFVQQAQISYAYAWRRILNKINSTNNIAVTYDD